MKFGQFTNVFLALDQGVKQMSPALAEAGRVLDGLSKNQLAPTMTKMSKELGDFSIDDLGAAIKVGGAQLEDFRQTKLVPIIIEVSKHVGDLGEKHLKPAMGATSAALEDFGRKKFVPAIVEAGNYLDDFGKTKLAPAIGHAASTLEEFRKNQLGPAIVTFAHELGPVLEEAAYKTGEAGNWAREHPVRSVLIVGAVGVYLCPAIVSSPVLGAVGFSWTGPVAGSLAAGLQTANTVAGGAFATFQSAQMGEYGAPIVAGVVKAGAVAVGAPAWFWPEGKEGK